MREFTKILGTVDWSRERGRKNKGGPKPLWRGLLGRRMM